MIIARSLLRLVVLAMLAAWPDSRAGRPRAAEAVGREEIGVETKVDCLAPLTFASHSYESFHLLMPLYVCRQWRGRVTPTEGQETAWVRAERLRDYPMPPADVPLIPILQDWL